MATQIKTIGVNGIEGYIIDVQVKLINGLSTMNIVGLGDVAVKEARDQPTLPGSFPEVQGNEVLKLCDMNG